MAKIAFVYPGQGAQAEKMGLELYENFDVVKEVFEAANASTDLDIKKLCFEGSIEELTKTENTQPTVLTVSTAITKLLEANGIKPEYSLGLSLGEYSALVQSNRINFTDAVNIVRKRAQFMKEAAANVDGSMKVCLGLNYEDIEKIIDENLADKGISVANINAPGQIVLTGIKTDLDAAEEIFLANGVRRYMDIKVDGPFHSEYLEFAYINLEKELQKCKLNNFNNPVISNFTAKEFASDTNEFINELSMQVKSSVKFMQSVQYLINEKGVDTFIEVGPGKTTSSLIKKIDKTVTCFNVDNVESFNNVLEKLK